MNTIDGFTTAIAALIAAPRTHAELRVLLNSHKDVPGRYTAALHAKGLIRIATWRLNDRGPLLAVWQWQKKPFFETDAPYPGKKHVRHAPVPVPEARPANSVFTWGNT